jgi:DNA phosphorothioation-dependent restriction protein DptH
MSHYPTMQPAGQTELYALLIEQMRPRLLRALESAGKGQRLRVTTLPQPVMEGICEALQGDSRWVARVLATANDPISWRATATKLIELRNVLEEPLLVFIPPGVRTAAEDSLDIATFTELSLATLAQDLVGVLLRRLPGALSKEIQEALNHLRVQKHIRNNDEEVEYLLTVLRNGASAEAAGGALYVFGLLPDFQLFTRGNVLYWLSRNINASEQLADGQPLQTAILRLPIRPGTVQTRLFAFLRGHRRGEVRAWAQEIATIADHRELSLDQWQFVDSGTSDDLRLLVEPLSLPRQTEDTVAGAAQLPILNLDARDPLKVALRSIPPPNQATAWKAWRVQVLSLRDGIPTVAWESNNFPKPQKLSRVSRNIKIQDLQSLEEGTYFLKVDAYDSDGTLLTRPRRVGENDSNSRAENESERFLVVRGKDIIVDPEDVRATFASSLLDAWMRVAQRVLSAKHREALPNRAVIRGTWDEPMGAPLKGDVHFELKGDGFAGFSIVVPSLLRRIERDILQHPDQLGIYALSFLDARSLADVELKRKEAIDLGEDSAVDAFLTTRQAFFRALYEHHLAREGDPNEDASRRAGLVETVDLEPFGELIERYANAYVMLAEKASASHHSENASSRIRALAHLDVIELRWRHGPGDPGRAMLIAPTHPLRVLWHLHHTRMCAEAVTAWDEGTRKAPDWHAFTDQLRLALLPMNLPMVIFDRRGRGYVEHTPLTHFWPLYLPDRGEGDVPLDAMATRDRVLEHMGVRDRNVALTTVDTLDVASRLYEYLAQHPYVDQLRLNVFNPGDGRLVADVLRYLEYIRLYDDGHARTDPPSLRYAVQLFAAAEFIDATGDGLEGLLDPERQVGEDDEFTLATSNHLLPKLVFARNPVTDFLQSPERFTAHVSILLEQFVVQSRVGRIDDFRRGSYVGGLVQEPETQVELQVGSHFGWVKGLRPVARRGASAEETLLRSAVSMAQRIQASFATGQLAEEGLAPIVALQLDPAGQALLKQVHEASDWVLTLDRNLGLDYFDSPSSAREAGYLLDFAPEYLQEDRQRILLTTRSHIELENLVRPIMSRYGLQMETGDEVLVLETLRSLSGRLALRLEGGRNQAAEVVGLLLARWLLDRVGLLQHRIVIPLDAHRSWFAGKDSSDSQRRADLLMVGFTEQRVLRFDIVEVKLREELTPSSRSDLYQQMRSQTENTADRLRKLFAQDLYPQPRADALLRAKELASALTFYVRRARRYNLLAEDESTQALQVLENLDDGYDLDIRSLGVFFEHKGQGLHVDEEEPGFTVYRFGGDKARQLLADAAGRLATRTTQLSERLGGTYRPPPTSQRRAEEAAGLKDDELEIFRSALSVPLPKSSCRPSHPSSDSMPVNDKWRRPVYTSDTGVHSGPPEANSATGTNSSLAGAMQPEVPAPEVAVPVGTLPSIVATPSAAPIENMPSAEASREVALTDTPIADILIGATEMSPQYGVFGKNGSQKVAIDLNGCNTISLFGVQGFGKSYTLGVIAEMASAQVPGINLLPSPLATVIFHYHKSDAYEPEYASAVAPNRKQSEVERLLRDYGARPCGLQDVVLLTPEAKVDQRRNEYPGITVEPIKFASSELGAESWKFLLGAYGNDSLYIRQLVAIMRRHRSGLTLDIFRQEILAAQLAPALQRLADDRINLAAPYIDDARQLSSLLRPGRTVIVDLRDEWIEKDEALGLFVVMLRIFAATKYEGLDFNKLVVFDEAHKYITESDLIGQVVETIREMRHQATTVVIASQDPLSVPRAVVELTSILILHRMTSPQWLKHLKSAISALDGLDEGHMASLAPGEALVWAQRATDKRFTLRPQKVHVRPRFTQHGGGTKTAVIGVTVR